MNFTQSRHSGPRVWRRALERSIAAGLLPGANATTVSVYEDLAPRMDYSTGHVRYCIGDVMKRTGLGKTAVSKHIALLRAAGWLVWVEHGSKRNVLKKLGLKGYAGTATVYAATIPPVFDTWAGNVLSSSGYQARVISVTDEARQRAVDRSRAAADAKAPRTPSRRVVTDVPQLTVGDKKLPTAARPRKNSSPRKTILGLRVTRPMADRAEATARRIRPLVWWVQQASIRELSWVLLDLVAKGLDEFAILNWLREIACTARRTDLGPWRPERPHKYIAARLQLEQRLAQEQVEAEQREAQERAEHEALMAAARPVNDEFAVQTQALRAALGEEPAFIRDLRDTAADAWQERHDPRPVLDAVKNLGLEGARTIYGQLVDVILPQQRSRSELAGACA